jgi:hypothetical protein
MALTVGLLPASGNASRINNIPKFLLPVSNKESLIQWHAKQMIEVCDEVRICTQAAWVPIIQNMNMKVKIIIKEKSTMSDAIKSIANSNEDLIIGMPDTFIVNKNNNIYEKMLNINEDIVLGAWKCDSKLQGKVGQIELKNNYVVSSKDKELNCKYKHMWGTMMLKNIFNHIDPKLDHPGKQLQDWLDLGFKIKAVIQDGKYIDAGTIDGIKELYKNL